MNEKTIWAMCVLLLVAAGCSHQPRIYDFKRDGFDFSRCDPLESGYAWCESRNRAKRGERLKL